MTKKVGIADRLQRELEDLVHGGADLFNAVVSIRDEAGAFQWEGAAGIANAGTGEAMRVDTPIFIASLTKMYTAAVTMLLEEQGLLALEDPLSKYLPRDLLEGLHRYKGRDYSSKLCVYHLISQTSGLPDYFMEAPEGGRSIFDLLVAGSDETWDVSRVAQIVRAGLQARFPPGTLPPGRAGKAYYADTNYQLLGAVIESAAKKPLQDVFAARIFEPLSLAATYLYGHAEDFSAGCTAPAQIYFKDQPLALDRAMASFWADGGMVSSVQDCQIFLQHLLQGRLFARKTTLPRMQHWNKIFFPFQYGLGLMRFHMPRWMSPFSKTPDLVGHSGSTSAFLFRSNQWPLYIAGTLNQVQNQGRPVRFMLKLLRMASETNG